VTNMYTSAIGWDTGQFVVMHSSVVSQCVIVTVPTDVCKRSVENHFLDLDVNVIVIIDIGLKELFHQMTVYNELRWVVFGCCGVVL
jgi:hypothetical protein